MKSPSQLPQSDGGQKEKVQFFFVRHIFNMPGSKNRIIIMKWNQRLTMKNLIGQEHSINSQ